MGSRRSDMTPHLLLGSQRHGWGLPVKSHVSPAHLWAGPTGNPGWLGLTENHFCVWVLLGIRCGDVLPARANFVGEQFQRECCARSAKFCMSATT